MPPKSKRFSSKRKHTCIADIKNILLESNEWMQRAELLKIVENRGHSETAMQSAIKKNFEIIDKKQDPNNRRSYIYKMK